MINYVEKNQLTISFRTFSSSKNLMPATRTYSPLTPQNPAESLQTNTCRYARYAETHPVQPLKGLREPRTASVSYRASSPYGERQPVPTKALLNRSSVPTQFLSDWHSVSTTAPPFRHTLYRFWPQETPPVWRNLRQNPRFNDTFTFSAKERDSETGLSYFGSRYYSSDLSIWLSVDPMSDKYASLSPYTYCADNPVKLVDPDGDTLYPSVAFKGSPYYNIYQHLLASNNIYKRLVSDYQGEKSNLYLDYSTAMAKKAGHTYWKHQTKGSDVSTTANTTYYRPNGMDQSEIGMVQTLLHEAVHAVDGLTQRKTPDHNGFDQASLLAGLIEYNSTYNLGYSNEDLEFLSWSGLQKSEEYRTYISNRAKLNKRTFEEEDSYVQSRITIINFTTNIDD